MVEFDGNVSGSRGSTPRKPEGYGSEPLTEEIAKKILIDFKKKDTDTSMRVSFDELSNAIIKEYVDNGYKRTDAHAQGETIADLLNYYQERAKEYDANGDGALNIDEYSAMFREKFEEEEKASKKPPATDAGGPTRAEEPKKPQQENNINNSHEERASTNYLKELKLNQESLAKISKTMTPTQQDNLPEENSPTGYLKKLGLDKEDIAKISEKFKPNDADSDN